MTKFKKKKKVFYFFIFFFKYNLLLNWNFHLYSLKNCIKCDCYLAGSFLGIFVFLLYYLKSLI